MASNQSLINSLVRAAEECVNDSGVLASETFAAQVTTLLETFHIEPNVSKLLTTAKGDETLAVYAASIGCSTSYVTDVINERKSPGPKIYEALGIEKPKRWR